MGAQLGSSKGAIGDINMTPLIDIVLVVLIIMMVNIPIELEQMTVKLPSPNPPPPATEVPPEQLVLAAYADGRFALNRRQMTEPILERELSIRLRGFREKRVFIDADSELEWGAVAHVIDLARRAGGCASGRSDATVESESACSVRVGLAKTKETGPLPPTSVAPGSAPRGVELGNPTVIGGMSLPKADRGMQKYKPEIERCYIAALAQSPELTGTMTIRLDIGPDGTQAGMDQDGRVPYEVSSAMFDGGDAAPLVECVGAMLPTMTFEALGENKTARVRYPLLFSPG
jgi:biopolymer transport protein ExbD